MNQNRKPRSVQATLEGRQKLQESKANKRNQKGKPWTFPNIADATGLDEKTIKRFFYGKPVDENTAIAIVQVLDLQSADIIDLNELYPSLETTVQEQNEIDWLKICHTKLEDQQKQIRKNASEMGFELDFPPVPLGLVERKHQQRRDKNVDRREVYRLEKEVIAKIYEHNDFLEQVINQNSTGKNKHIAIVGEPGAGKTTLLSAVGSYIKNKTSNLPIFISLGSLEEMTLEEYLLKKWLPDAIKLFNPDLNTTSEIEKQLNTRFYKGGVWLLLDGVDEIGESSPGETLSKISQALTDWLGKARVVLTCRLNVWDASITNNDLPGFDTYKTQEFKPEQVDNFIEEWFKCDNKIQEGEELKTKLREPGKERICELVTNPLRLCLLCQIFYNNKHGNLPETKAELYSLYTQNFYAWKRELVPQNLNYTLKQELHRGLGRLALAGINSDARFRLNESLAVQEMGQDLFDLACNVGWLNQVDRDANSNEAVYAFFHANFQEYFAALVIDDWRDFLNHVSDNPNTGTYRFFEDKWKEVIILWMERMKTDALKFNKNLDFVNYVDNFQDNCGGFYEQKARKIIDNIIDSLTKNSTEIDIKQFMREYLASSRDKGANASTDSLNLEQISEQNFDIEQTTILPKSDIFSGKELDHLIELLNDTDVNKQRMAAEKIAKDFIHINNNTKQPHESISHIEDIIQVLLKGIESGNYHRKYEIISTLFDVGYSEIFSRLLHSQDIDICLCAAIKLGEFKPRDKNSIETIIDVMESICSEHEYEDDPDYYYDNENIFPKIVWAVEKLRNIQNYDYSLLVSKAITNIKTNPNWYIRIELLKMLQEIGVDSSEFRQLLNHLIKSDDNTLIRAKSAYIFGKIEPGNEIVINTLEKLLSEMLNGISIGQHNSLEAEIAKELLELDFNNSTALKVLIDLICVSANIFANSFYPLECLLEALEYNIDKLLQLSSNNILIKVDESRQHFWFLYTRSLPDNDQEIIVRYIFYSKRIYNHILHKDANLYIPLIKEIFEGNFNICCQQFPRWFQEHEQWQETLSQWSDNAGKEWNKNKKLQGEEVLDSSSFTRTYEYQKFIIDNRPSSSIAYEICRQFLDCYAQNMTYPEFYHAWHGESSPIQTLENQFTDTHSHLSKLQPTEKTYPLTLNLKILQNETDIIEISQEICNQIYFTACSENTDIPAVNNAPQLKSKIPQIKKHLQTENIALIINNCEPNQTMITFCNKLTDVLHIAFITEQPLDAPLKGFPQNQPNLLSAIQSWINEMG
ncbi:NACHT domain-containing protein [Anabaena sp. UHCC 0253]|uniref:NACHT domain-containing protein n=1 Tax=Anabaena sp. UHCC 0253 TaxID=2590019 RepID=UPI001445B32A|nr:NACHT domain-containing protein [Anabaena sp. UHCC 0253]MTJ51496.1 NACHT domain-containing protein [Anabaena sp. UHCC 0253]